MHVRKWQFPPTKCAINIFAQENWEIASKKRESGRKFKKSRESGRSPAKLGDLEPLYCSLSRATEKKFTL